MIFDVQKANMWKRVSAFLFDAIFICILAAGFGFLISLIFGFDAKEEEMQRIYARYESDYGITLDITEAEYAALPEEEKAAFNRAMTAMEEDETLAALYRSVVGNSYLTVSLSLFLAFFVLDFLVPLFLGNGQTPGKKIFGIALMRFDLIRVGKASLFVRAVLGKYAVETMIPVTVLLMLYFGETGVGGLVLLGLLLIAQLILFFTSGLNQPIHDKLAATVAVDYASQLIFDSPEKKEVYRLAHE